VADAVVELGALGPDDQLGTLNLITPAKRKAALALVKEGVPVSLSTNTFFKKEEDVPCPAEWAMLTATDTGATDRVAYPCIHGAAATTSIRSRTRSSAERCGTGMTPRNW
jgi:hypothetical protein